MEPPKGIETRQAHGNNLVILPIFDLRFRKLVQRTKKYVSRALLAAHRNWSKITRLFIEKISIFSGFRLSFR